MNNQNKLGQILKQKGLINSEQLQLCLDVQYILKDVKLGAILRHYNFVSEGQIVETVSKQVNWPIFKGDYKGHKETVHLLGHEFCENNRVLPFLHEGKVNFIVSWVHETQITDKILKVDQFKSALFFVGFEDKIIDALKKCKKPEVILKENNQDDDIDVNGFFKIILISAIEKNASDIHIEPSAKALEVRFRIDGVLHYQNCLPIECTNRLANIIFNFAGVQHSDFNKFHDARFEYNHINKSIDIRVSHIPSIYGSNIVLRLLDKNRSSLILSDLGFEKSHLEVLNSVIYKPEGIILLCGPTGCGKTTTLYSILNQVKSIETKMVTVEDPVEIRTPLISQVMVNKKVEINFENSVRSFLRHDPDTILIGEIRDKETAQMAVRAAITGHKVYSTIHTTSPLEALMRLKDFGINYSYLANSLLCIIAQRLVRVLCNNCKATKKVSDIQIDGELKNKFIDEDTKEVAKAVGCSECLNGYKGRRVVSEILKIDNEVKALIIDERIGDLYRLIQKSDNKLTFINHAKELIKNKITSIEEIKRVLG